MFIRLSKCQNVTGYHWKDAGLRTSDALVDLVTLRENFGSLHWKRLTFLNESSKCGTDKEPYDRLHWHPVRGEDLFIAPLISK